MTTVTAFFLAAAALAVQEASATTYGYCYDGWGRESPPFPAPEQVH